MNRRFLAPEVVQTSAMDCGPASLKCLLEGLGLPVSYGRLREACQTDVDGTSIDTLEDVAGMLGVKAGQVILPRGNLLVDGADTPPAIVVVQLPNGFTHFVVLWRCLGPWVQIMDPAVGRRWMRAEAFLDQVYVHEMQVPFEDWWAWASSEDFRRPLARRLERLGLPPARATRLADEPEPERLMDLEASASLVAELLAQGALRRGAEASAALERLAAMSAGQPELLPPRHRAFSRPDEESVRFRGAVLVQAHGVESPDLDALPRDLALALSETPPQPERALLEAMRADGLLTPLALGGAAALAAGGVLVEALLLRGLLDVGRSLVSPEQRWIGGAGLLVFLLAMLLLELPIAGLALAMGRRLETRLRVAIHGKIPRLGDAYLRSRPASDMAERAHVLQLIRGVPQLGLSLVRTSVSMLLTTAGLIWLSPGRWPLALLEAALCLGVPLLVAPLIAERDLRARVHTGALASFYRDALQGITAIRAQGAGGALLTEHEARLTEQVQALRDRRGVSVLGDLLQSGLGFGAAACLLIAHVLGGGEPVAVLLLAWWALNLPLLGRQLAQALHAYPSLRNITLRLLEPLAAPEEEHGAELEAGEGAVALSLEGVSVVAGGRPILHEIELAVAAGEHVAVVGRSGAGKSTLLGLLLGWTRPASGQVQVDGAPLVPARLRPRVAWVDPAVQLWNASVLDNLRYGLADADPGATPLGELLDTLELRSLIEGLPEGLRSEIGEDGGLLSGGQGQRLRLGRALQRPAPGLVLLDEPFRGLDRARRDALMQAARERWRGATLLAVTHDIDQAARFDRVLVVEEGRLVEQGAPAALIEAGGRFAELLAADAAAREQLWADPSWRAVELAQGRARS
ncbi:MAG: ATP-binding cassette domain-containing protein [Alphaproteobacteria bacterium]|nr:ATP-binding cassette domain-containing protein [Alphaproteobacteria bacterium]